MHIYINIGTNEKEIDTEKKKKKLTPEQKEKIKKAIKWSYGKLRVASGRLYSTIEDKIFDGRVYDLGVIYAWGGTDNSIGTFMNKVAFSGNQTFTSSLETITPTVEADLLKTLNAFGK